MESKLMLDENKRRQAWDGLRSLIDEAHDNAVQHGFYDEFYATMDHFRDVGLSTMATNVRRDFILAQLCKVAGEIGEAVSAIQRGETSQFPEELADILIRTLDLAGFCCQDFEQTVIAKMERNRSRPYKHGKCC